MKKRHKISLGVVVGLAAVTAASVYLHHHTFAVLQPAGEIAGKERNLIILAASLSLIVVVPVFGLLGVFAWRYRESNTKAPYSPELEGSKLAETIWWLIPSVLIAILAVVTWRSSYALDPYKPIASNKPTLHIQVVALDWKWLFIYPQQHVASVNQLAIPVNTPVDFELTSDTVMNAFWIPQLGGQMYAMPGMSMQLNLEADKLGSYRGVSSNISGKGFADMKFMATAMSSNNFDQWIQKASSAPKLTSASYAQLARQSVAVHPKYYSAASADMYNGIVMKYMTPYATSMSSMSMNGMVMQ